MGFCAKGVVVRTIKIVSAVVLFAFASACKRQQVESESDTEAFSVREMRSQQDRIFEIIRSERLGSSATAAVRLLDQYKCAHLRQIRSYDNLSHRFAGALGRETPYGSFPDDWAIEKFAAILIGIHNQENTLGLSGGYGNEFYIGLQDIPYRQAPRGNLPGWDQNYTGAFYGAACAVLDKFSISPSIANAVRNFNGSYRKYRYEADVKALATIILQNREKIFGTERVPTTSGEPADQVEQRDAPANIRSQALPQPADSGPEPSNNNPSGDSLPASPGRYCPLGYRDNRAHLCVRYSGCRAGTAWSDEVYDCVAN